jgi:hypothetical protein
VQSPPQSVVRVHEGQGYRAFGEAEYSALPKFTNGGAIISTAGTIIGSPASAFATGYRPALAVNPGFWPRKLGFAPDWPLEGGVSCELVSENAKFLTIRSSVARQ